MGMLISLLKRITSNLEGLDCKVVKDSFACIQLGSTKIVQAYEKNNLLIIESCVSLDNSLDFGRSIVYDETSLDDAYTDLNNCISEILDKLNEVNSLEFTVGLNLDNLCIVTREGEILADVGVSSNGFYCDIRLKDALYNKDFEGMVNEVCKILGVNPGIGLYYNYN